MRSGGLLGTSWRAGLCLAGSLTLGAESGNNAEFLSPSALVASPSGHQLYVGCATASQCLVVDTERLQVTRSLPLPGPCSGLALTADGTRLFLTSPSPASRVFIVDTTTGTVVGSMPAGHTAVDPVLAGDGTTLFVCSRFDNVIRVLDVAARVERASIPMSREPISEALTPDGQWLLVANHLPTGPATLPHIAAKVILVDAAKRRVQKEFLLPDGSMELRDIRVSQDGNCACVPHLLARYQDPTERIERGAINRNVLTVLDIARRTLLGTVALDEAGRGAANPWALAWSGDGRWLCVTHAGTHELSVIDWPAFVAKLRSRSRQLQNPVAADVRRLKLQGKQSLLTSAATVLKEARSAVVSPPGATNDLTADFEFLSGLRRRVPLTVNGPRSVAVVGSRAFVAGYFSDSLDIVELSRPAAAIRSVALGSSPTTSRKRQGEMFFNDATLCREGWQSCASCHGDDGRIDALNWDLPNDGLGNPKDTRSLVFAQSTPPSMSLGVRANSRAAVRAGLKSTLFSDELEPAASAMDAWIRSLQPLPSPYLVHGVLSPAAQRGERLFHDPKVGCAWCHPAGLFSDLRSYDVGTRARTDQPDDVFDTPTLCEVWRTAPYLHDGSAGTLREVLTTRNPADRHGRTSHLTVAEIEALIAYLLSL
ncbi:MAG: cell surface protein [Verrucomicrobia bacterium]|nr:cell surface protein [Verrucomicrobiota bacterium]